MWYAFFVSYVCAWSHAMYVMFGIAPWAATPTLTHIHCKNTHRHDTSNMQRYWLHHISWCPQIIPNTKRSQASCTSHTYGRWPRTCTKYLKLNKISIINSEIVWQTIIWRHSLIVLKEILIVILSIFTNMFNAHSASNINNLICTNVHDFLLYINGNKYYM